MSTKQSIYYTFIGEAPALATVSLFPIFGAFAKEADIELKLIDISLASRVISAFADFLPADKKVEDGLKFLSDLAANPEAKIVKLPNISVSLPQALCHHQRIEYKRLRTARIPGKCTNGHRKNVLAIYSKVLGSAVNPVLRQGSSDRRALAVVKKFVRKQPHSMGRWSKTSVLHACSCW